MKRSIHHREKFLWLIILHLGIDVHSCFAIFMSCKVLDGLGVNPRVQQVGDVGMAQQMRRHMVSAPVIKCKKTPRKKCSFVAEVKGKR